MNFLLLLILILLSACVSPDRGAIAYTVDKAGNITSRTDARGVVTNYTWDALNRLTAIAYPNDSSLDATLTYDDNPDTSGACGDGVGRLCRVVDASGTADYKYNALGHLTEVKETRGALTFTTEYAYDLAGNITGITLPSGREITYARNANGQVSSVTADVAGSPVNLAASITYLPFGPISGFTYGNSLTFSATYDQDYNPTSRAVSTIYNHTYDTDDNGNIIQIGGTDYAYDELNRLEEEDSGSAINYTYDATSNRLTKVNGGTTTTTVPSTSNKISAVGANSYTYDAAGNITDDGTNTYTWNDAGQLAEVLVSSTPVGTYTYDSQNRRTKKVAGANTTHYVYGAGGLLYGEYDNSGNLIREYVYLNGAPLAQVDAGSPEVLTYLHTDHLGTPRFGTNAGGSQVWAWNGDAFGIGAPSGSVTVNLRMPGQYADAESGLFYNWNRYYNPAIGRYISSDPIGIDGGLNTFLYAEASPVMYVDPEGLVIGCGWPSEFGNTGIECGIGGITPLAGGRGGRLGSQGNSPKIPNKTNSEKTSSVPQAPDFIVSPGGTIYPVPKGATGPYAIKGGRGMEFTGGSGGMCLDPRVSNFRYMSPTTTGKYPYPYGRGTYTNIYGQTVNPITGRTIPPSNPWWHIPGGE